MSDDIVAGNDQQNTGEDQQPEPNQEIQELSNRLEELEQQRKQDQRYISQLQQKKEEPQSQPPDENEVDKQTLEWLNQRGYVRKDDVDKTVEAKLAEREGQRQIADAVKSLSSTYNGEGEHKDYPPFKEEDVLPYAQQNNIFDLEVAYRSLNNDKILAAEVNKAIESSKKSTATPDRSDAPSVEPVDQDTIAKEITPDVARDPQKLAQALTKLGMGSIPSK